MTKLYFDDNLVTRSLLPKLEDSIESLNKIISIIDDMNIPYDFSYRQYIKDMRDTLNARKKDMNNLVSNINSSRKAYSSTFDNINNSINRIDSFSIKRRTKIIR